MNTETNDGIWEDVARCEEHTFHDNDCEACSTQMTQMTAIIDQLQAEAQSRAGGLAQQGMNVPQEVINSIRLDLIVDTILPDPKNRVLFEGELGRRIIQTLKAAQEQLKEPTLMTPPQQKLTVVRNGRRK